MEELDFLRKVKSVTFATLEDGAPKARIVDVMNVENEVIYFLTARGKSFYRQLINNPNVAIVGMDSKYDTVRVYGKAYAVPDDEQDMRREQILQLNPGLDLYNEKQKDILTVFAIKAGTGDFMGLSSKPPVRKQFAFGGEKKVNWGYEITDKCIACGTCVEYCCLNIIKEGTPYSINSDMCMECGKCVEVCPVGAIRKK